VTVRARLESWEEGGLAQDPGKGFKLTDDHQVGRSRLHGRSVPARVGLHVLRAISPKIPRDIRAALLIKSDLRPLMVQSGK
jgi:hypothetical protein